MLLLDFLAEEGQGWLQSDMPIYIGSYLADLLVSYR